MRCTRCTAKINAALTKRADDACYVFVNPTGAYNHNVSELLYQYYAENRCIRDPLLLNNVKKMRAPGSHPKVILTYLRKNTNGLSRLSTGLRFSF